MRPMSVAASLAPDGTYREDDRGENHSSPEGPLSSPSWEALPNV